VGANEWTPGVDVWHCARLVENVRKTRDVIDPLMVEIAANGAGVPEAMLPGIERTFGKRTWHCCGPREPRRVAWVLLLDDSSCSQRQRRCQRIALPLVSCCLHSHWAS